MTDSHFLGYRSKVTKSLDDKTDLLHSIGFSFYYRPNIGITILAHFTIWKKILGFALGPIQNVAQRN